jgi:hypothetical protein
MSRFSPGQRVKVLGHRPSVVAYDGFHPMWRKPRVGDVGVVKEVFEADEFGIVRVEVECFTPGGNTAWIEDFAEDELELVGPSPR